jgi:hypothetical protein
MSLRGVVRRKGAAVTFTKSVPGTYDPETDTSTAPSTLSVPGYAMKVSGDPDTYARLQLIESEAPTLEFVPDTIGDAPVLGMTVDFGGETLTVKDVDTLAMNGTPEAAFVVVSR